jgi:hypothetical protein
MKRFFLRLASILATGCLLGTGLAGGNPALPPCSKFPSGRKHVYPWTATLANGVLSAPLPSYDHRYYYFDFVAAEHEVETDATAEKFAVIVPRSLAPAYDYRFYLLGRAEHANGRYYFTGVYEVGVGDPDDTDSTSARRQDTLEVVLSGKFCFDSSG